MRGNLISVSRKGSAKGGKTELPMRAIAVDAGIGEKQTRPGALGADTQLLTRAAGN